jgi:hypothetical protein
MTWRRRLLTGAAAVLLAAVATLAVLRAQGALFPGEDRASRPLDLTARADADSARVASLARARCRLLSGAERRACLQEFLLALVEQGRVRLAIGTLGRLGARDGRIRREGHEYSHVIGINAWRPGKDLGEVYGQCSELFQSGCYHGVIQAYFAWNGTDSATVADVCTSSPVISQTGWLRFQCVHGVGHALVQARSLHLPRALDGCDQLREPFDQESCYGGAFMEFIVGARGQSHHPRVGPPAADSAAEDHEHAGHDAAPAFALRDPNDLLYPCTAVGEKYRRQCYQMQAGIIFETANGDVEKMARACNGAPAQHRKSCYHGIGTYVSGLTARDAGRTIRICSLGDPEYREWCFVGVVKNFIDVTAKPGDGIDYCRLLEEPRLASRCYVAVGEQIAFLLLYMKDRRDACGRAEPRYVNACLYGAGLVGEPPPDLVGT